MNKYVFVSGSFDCLHPGHVAFFKEAAKYGDLHVGIGSDESITTYKGKHPVFTQDERLFMVKSIRYVKNAWINSGMGPLDFIDDIVSGNFEPDILIVNEDQDSDGKKRICENRGIKYIVLKRIPEDGLPARSTTQIRQYYEATDNN